MSNPGNKMGVVHLTILTAVNMLGSGIIMLPTKLAEVGTMSILSWLVTALGSLALAWAFSKCGLFSTKSGGMGVCGICLRKIREFYCQLYLCDQFADR